MFVSVPRNKTSSISGRHGSFRIFSRGRRIECRGRSYRKLHLSRVRQVRKTRLCSPFGWYRSSQPRLLFRLSVPSDRLTGTQAAVNCWRCGCSIERQRYARTVSKQNWGSKSNARIWARMDRGSASSKSDWWSPIQVCWGEIPSENETLIIVARTGREQFAAFLPDPRRHRERDCTVYAAHGRWNPRPPSQNMAKNSERKARIWWKYMEVHNAPFLPELLLSFRRRSRQNLQRYEDTRTPRPVSTWIANSSIAPSSQNFPWSSWSKDSVSRTDGRQSYLLIQPYLNELSTRKEENKNSDVFLVYVYITLDWWRNAGVQKRQQFYSF